MHALDRWKHAVALTMGAYECLYVSRVSFRVSRFSFLVSRFAFCVSRSFISSAIGRDFTFSAEFFDLIQEQVAGPEGRGPITTTKVVERGNSTSQPVCVAANGQCVRTFHIRLTLTQNSNHERVTTRFLSNTCGDDHDSNEPSSSQAQVGASDNKNKTLIYVANSHLSCHISITGRKRQEVTPNSLLRCD